MRKILYIITQSNWGGAQKYVYDLATNLRGDFEITVACGGRGQLVSKLAKNRIEVIIFKNLVREINPIKDIICLYQLYKFIKRNGFDIIHTNSSKAEILGNIAAKLAKTPKIVFTAHGFVFNEPMSNWKKRFFIRLERFSNRFSTNIIAVSKFDKQTAIREKIAPESKIKTIYHGLDLNKFENLKENKKQESQIPKDVTIVGTVANFYPVKGLKYFIKAASLVNKEFPKTYFLIIGDGNLKTELKKQIKKLNLQDKIILVGFRSDVLKLMSLMDIFTINSLKEGMPYCLLEAMALGLPIVTTKVGGIPEIIENKKTGLLVEPTDFYSLAENIKILIKNKELKEELSKNAKEKIKNFDIKKMIEKTYQIYSS